MKRSLTIALVLACGLGLHAQSPAAGEHSTSGQKTTQQTPSGAQSGGVNPFPENSNDIPILPAANAPNLSNSVTNSAISVPADDLDPVRSPDDSLSDTTPGQNPGFSSSMTGLDSILPKPDDTQPGKGKGAGIAPVHQETAKEDINVGNYYLDNHDWRGALSRFQSAMVLSPDDPDVYWGLAECARHLGDLANARAYYIKVAEYDPTSRHGKDARKALKDPEIANAQKPGSPQSSPGQQH